MKDYDSKETESKGSSEDSSKMYGYRWWLSQVKQARKDAQSWRDEADKFESEWNEPLSDNSNIFYSNTKLEAPAIYSRIPAIVSKVRYGSKDAPARVGAMTIEKATAFQAEEKPDFDKAMRSSLHEGQMCGRGVARIRYEKEEQDIEVRVDLFPQEIPETMQLDPMTGQPIPGTGEVVLLDVEGIPAPDGIVVEVDENDGSAYYLKTEIDIIREEVIFEHVSREDFNHSCANTWKKVKWVSFDQYLDKQEVEEKYGKDIAEKLAYEVKVGSEADDDRDPNRLSNSDDSGEPYRVARIIEVWCKSTRKVYYISEEYPGFLKVVDDPYKLKDFFPCPEPFYINLQRKKLRSKSDYAYYRHKVKLYELLLQRERELIEALIVRGLAEESFFEQLKSIQRVGNVEFVPVNMTSIMERGGVKSLIDVFVIPEIAPMLQQIEAEKQQIKQEIFEISGMADIIRGVSDPNETATAQQIKGQFATMRLGEKQKAFQNFARDCLVLAAEFIAENFDESTLWKLSAMDFEDEQDKATFPQALALIRRDGLRRISIDIETDSTIAITEDLRKAAWAEYMATLGGQIPSIIMMMQQYPTFAGFFAKLIDAGSRLHRFGRAVEQELDQSIDGLMQQMQTPPQPPQPDINQQMEMKKLELQEEKQAQDFQVAMADLQVKQEQFQKDQEQKYAKLLSDVQSMAARLSHDFDMQTRKRADSEVNRIRQDLAVTPGGINA